MFLVISLLVTSQVDAQEFSHLYQDYSLSREQKIKEGLFYSVVSEDNLITQDLIDEIGSNRLELIAQLKLKQPELTQELKSFDNGLKKDQEVQDILNHLIQELSINGVVPDNNSIERYSKSIGLNTEVANSLQFYIGYEYFKQKQFKEAKKLFQKINNDKSLESSYALFYNGLISLIEHDFTEAHKLLLKIKNQSALASHLPYYLSSSLYGMEKYDELIKYYSPRQKDRSLFNVKGIVELIALANYHNNDFTSSLQSIAQLNTNSIKPIFVELNAIMNNSLGNYNETIRILDKVNYSTLTNRLKFEKAFALGMNGTLSESNQIFNDLINTSIPIDIIYYNLSINYAKLNDVEQSINYANKVQDQKFQKGIRNIINTQISQVSNPLLIAQLSQKSLLSNESKEKLLKSLFNNGLSAYKAGNTKEYESVVSTLIDIAPNSQEYLSLTIISAIDNISRDDSKANLIELEIASKKLEKINSNISILIDANYHLGYYYFRQKKSSIALGYFTEAYEILKKQESLDTDLKSIQSDMIARMGDSYLINEDYERALISYNDIIINNQDKKDYAIYQSALINQIKGNHYDQIILLEELITSYPNSDYKFQAILKIAKSYFSLGQYDKSKFYYNNLLEQSQEIKYRDIANLQLGLINVNAGDYDKAELFYLKIINTSDNVEYVELATSSLKEIYSDYSVNTDALIEMVSNDSKESPEDVLFNFSKTKYIEKEYGVALEEFEKLNKNYPKHSFRLEVDYYILKIKKDLSKINNQDIVQYILQYDNSPYIKELQQLLYDQLLIGNNQIEIINYYEKEWFSSIDNATYTYLKSKIELNQLNKVDKKIIELSKANYNTERLSKLTMSLFYAHASDKEWKNALSIIGNNKFKHLFISNPKSIYHIALAEFNLDNTTKTISYITDNYQQLIEDIAWLTKSVILLSDAYFMNGEKELAIASLEGLLQSEISIPKQLRSQAQERLDNLNL